MFAVPTSCLLLSDTTHVYTVLVNFTSTVILSSCTDWFDHCHVKFAPDWSVWHLRVMLSFSHSMIPAPNVGVVVMVTFAVATVPYGIFTLRFIHIKHLREGVKNVSKQSRQVVSTNISNGTPLTLRLSLAPVVY